MDHVKMLILTSVLLTCINTIYKYCQAWVYYVYEVSICLTHGSLSRRPVGSFQTKYITDYKLDKWL